MNNWTEPLPEQCPPAQAVKPDGQTFYRLTENSVPSENDFRSLMALFPLRRFPDQCIARAVSIWDDPVRCSDLRKLPRHRGKTLVAFKLDASDGVIQQTFQAGHYSWWRTNAFDVASASQVKEIE